MTVNAVELLQQQQDNLNQLIILLEQELSAFKSRQADEVYQIAQSKNALIDQIQQTDKSISELADLEQLKAQDDFAAKVEQIENTLAEVKNKNAINERVIRTSLNNVQRLKQSILALKNADAMTYDKQGQAQTQTLGKGIKA
ncbi:flagellar synthesis protein FlgN [Catenovulum agarivorans DS-2]|uniref:Flagellar synthesis protein FlgN n=1 Tax=Catenovulum agarivorans DS-2 TaxID=1328313 RepID=W7QXC9_9ALTE|nr:flagellar export chaperone FlgN [Catenovulum agarivorans]EWH09940.1 flagellar synthesis protein FlgN [Catenovulum agarivorans DS-2]